tara:strand:- start:22 stop:360 length:339 start_codon:yes stop_codon:yes gene_type:complete
MSNSNINEKIVKNYIEAFNRKDINFIREILTEDVCLKDWIVNLNGMDNVINMFKEIFNNNDLLKIKLINLISDNDHFAAEIEIEISDKELLEVVDIFKFKNEKISSIKAYKC